MHRHIEIAGLRVVIVHDGFEIFVLRVAGFVVKYFHVDTAIAQLGGDPIDHTPRLVDLIENAASPAHVFTVTGRYDNFAVCHRDSAGTWNEPPMKAVMA